MATIYVDGQAYDVKDGDNLLQAILGLGLDLPYFCWHPAMGSIGACRQCAVVQYQNEEDTRGRIVMGCMTPVADGARFSLQGEAAREFRSTIIEALMLNHPHDCPVCAEGGECHLQDMTVMAGHRDRHYRGRKNTHRNQYLGPLINHEMNRCITCYRCVRFYNDYAGGTDLSAQASRDHTYFGRQTDGVLESEFAGNLVEVCPTGVFTDKTLVNDYTRKWDLQSAPSVCVNCALGCNTMPGERYGKLKRIHNRFNKAVNGYFLCDRGRYGGNFVNSDKRLDYPGLRQADQTYKAVGQSEAIERITEHWGDGRAVAAIGSPRASLESNYLLQKLVGAGNFNPGLSDREFKLIDSICQILRCSKALSPSMSQVEQADAVLILGEDVTNTAPRLALSLRQSVRNKATELGEQIGLQYWQDAALRTLAQDRNSPLFIAAVADTRLDDIAEQTVSLAPDDIARLGLAIAAQLDPAKTTGNGLDDPLRELAATIAAALKNARQPLIVSGTGCQNLAVIQAAARIAEALTNTERTAMLSYCLPEANSLGGALLCASGNYPSLAELTERAATGQIETLLVMENELYRRGTAAEITALLDGVTQLVVIDALDSRTLSRSDIALPADSYFESEGTLINSEGRAQRYYPVIPAKAGQQASWQWLAALGDKLGAWETGAYRHFDQVTSDCAADHAPLAEIVKAGPDHHFRDHGLKVPRQPHRYSGRTAMRANVSVHEPKQPIDGETPLAFTMEGAQPSGLMAFSWSPGWNSNQSVHKFQSEVAGPLVNGCPGVRLIEPGEGLTDMSAAVEPAAAGEPGSLLLVPLYRIYGSEELSVQSPAIAELAGNAFIQLHPSDATRLGVADGDGLVVNHIEAPSLEVRLNSSLAVGCAGFPVGYAGTENLVAGQRVTCRKAANWTPLRADSAAVIATDQGGGHV